MRIVLLTLAALLLVLLVAGVWQIRRYLEIRREIVHDAQPLFYGGDSFHVVTLLELAEGAPLLPTLREFKNALPADALPIYAGKVVRVAMQSEQLEPVDWDAVFLTQFPSREAYDEFAASPAQRAAVAPFARSYAMGMQRSAALNLGLPLALLGIRALDIATLRWTRLPFEPGDQIPDEARRTQLIAALRAERELGAEAVVVLNFLKSGSAEQQRANRGYGREMLGLMAEVGNGPMHMATAVPLDGSVFESVAIVYYPGVDYFADLIGSRFFGDIVGGKQLADTQAMPTVPLLSQL
jgi:hypothetical protein